MAESKRIAQVRHSLRLTGLLLEIQAVFQETRVAFIAFKGPTLSLLLYGDVATRAYSDLDILVSADDLVVAHRALTAIGFQPDFQVGDAQLEWLARRQNEFGLRRKGTRIELHTAVVRPGYSFSLSFEDLRPHQSAVEIAGRKVPVLNREALAVVLAVHGAKHAWSRRLWMEDFVRLLVGSAPVDWTALFAFADEHGATRFVLQAAWLARREFDVAWPPIVEQRLRSDLAARITARVASYAGKHSSNALALLSFTLGMSDRSSRLRVLQQLLIDPSPLDCEWVRLPESLFPFYHAIRPVRLIGKHVLGFRQRPWSH